MAVENDGYNDAWNTPGWTAQNMAYPPEGTNSDTPVLPHVRLFGTYTDSEDRFMNGVVTAVPSVRVVSLNGVQYFLDPKRHHIERGTVSFDIPIGSWSWEIRQRIGPQTFVDTIQPAVDTDLSTLTHAVEADFPETVILDGGSA